MKRYGKREKRDYSVIRDGLTIMHFKTRVVVRFPDGTKIRAKQIFEILPQIRGFRVARVGWA